MHELWRSTLRSYVNDFGGTTIELALKDDLRKVPLALQHLITPRVADAFLDPHSHFADIARRTSIAAMRKWLEKMLAGTCHLLLSTTYEESRYDVAFKWSVWEDIFEELAAGRDVEIVLGEAKPVGAEICLPPVAELDNFSPQMRTYFSLVGEVRWHGIGHAGSLFAAGKHDPMSVSLHGWQDSPALDKSKTHQFGTSENGTPLVYAFDGKAGWWNSESRFKGLTQSMEEVMEWVYGELLAGRRPVD